MNLQIDAKPVCPQGGNKLLSKALHLHFDGQESFASLSMFYNLQVVKNHKDSERQR